MKKSIISLLTLGLVGCASVNNETVIEASPQEVWAVLTDTASYPEWNPVILSAEGKLEEGEKVVMQFREPGGKQYEIKAKVKQVIPEKLLNQYGGTWGIITFDHTYALEPVPEGTKVTIHEDYKGAYVLFWDHTPMEVSYAEVNKALKQRVMDLKSQSK
ncbi:SRPBCC domain-containing protein [Vibrio sp. JC009]|uniref:SRPBCC domain-containing protein n=1 Tax=Vibrio sp. JC009 TaxID=2912314 RepID=UPI0023AECED9|nr:SRPBCC domain-containing protein [Vibrio sp. JC009]WED23227.1 SRPBCC domain-containing protein [Vibrio sp. JC009]